MNDNDNLADLRGFLGRLSAQDAIVLKKYFDIKTDAQACFDEIGQQYSVTRQRVREIEARAKKKLSSDEPDPDTTD